MTSRRLLPLVAMLCVAAGLALPASSATGGDTITTVAGTGANAAGPGVDGDVATATAIDHPRGLAVLPGGGYLVTEPFRNTVRRVGADGRVARVAGTGERGFSGDGGPATSADLDLVHAVALTPDGGFVIADTGNNRIRRVAADGTITTVVGTGQAGYSGDGGPAVAARIEGPRGVAVLPDGGLLFPDSGNDRIRRVWPDGTITTVAGNGVRGYGGDGGPATSAELDLPFAVDSLPNGGFLVADAGNNRIRRVSPGGTIATVAGTGIPGYSGDGGAATAAELDAPHFVLGLADGGFLVADTLNNRVRRVSPAGTITTVAGTGVAGYSGDGDAATSAALDQPKALALLPGATGLLVGDAVNNRVRLIAVDLRPALELRLVTSRLHAKAGHPAVLRYVVSEPAGVRLSVARGATAVLGVRTQAKAGSNRLSFGARLRPGRYVLRVVASTADGRSRRAAGSLTIVR